MTVSSAALLIVALEVPHQSQLSCRWSTSIDGDPTDDLLPMTAEEREDLTVTRVPLLQAIVNPLAASCPAFESGCHGDERPRPAPPQIRRVRLTRGITRQPALGKFR